MVSMNQGLLRREIVEGIVPYNPEKIILFGSWAYGTPSEESDVDICVVKKSTETRWDEIRKIRQSLSAIPFEKDIIIETPEFLASHSGEEWINTAWYDIVHDGIVLYEKR